MGASVGYPRIREALKEELKKLTEGNQAAVEKVERLQGFSKLFQKRIEPSQEDKE